MPGACAVIHTPPGRAPFLRALRHRSSRSCSGVSSVLRARPTPHLFPDSFVSSTSCRGPVIAEATAGQMRSPRFRHVPFVRDGVFDHGGAAAPRITVLFILPSAFSTASASTGSGLSRLNNPPHTIAVYASQWSSPSITQHSLPGGCYTLPASVFHRLDRASFPGAPKNPVGLRRLRPVPDIISRAA